MSECLLFVDNIHSEEEEKQDKYGKIVRYEKKMIEKSEKRLFILSPYLQLNDEIKELLKTCQAEVSIICRGESLYKDEYEKIEEIQKANPQKIKLYCSSFLHAKMMVNENGWALVSSKNLYEYSETNYEAGIFFARGESENTQKLYADALVFCRAVYENLEECVSYPNKIKKQHLFTKSNWDLIKKTISEAADDKRNEIQDTIARAIFSIPANINKIVSDSSCKTYNIQCQDNEELQENPTEIDVDGKKIVCNNGLLDGFKNAVRKIDELVNDYNSLVNDYNLLVAENERLRKKLESDS